jgi:type III pantothenate kinase
MAPIVVDVGNTRIKWGRCDAAKVIESVSLPPDKEDAWQAQWQQWNLLLDTPWLVSGVHPPRRDALVAWLRQRGAQVDVLTSFRQLPLQILVEAPEKVGIDRLLNAVAANRRRAPDTAAVLVDAGSAVTVDYLDPAGVFRGGAIFPGFRLMSSALHDYTALLPIVEMDEAVEAPGASTVRAIQLGVSSAVLGGIERLIAEYRQRFPTSIVVFLTGGDAKHLTINTIHALHLWPEMTLEGVLHSKSTSPNKQHGSTEENDR